MESLCILPGPEQHQLKENFPIIAVIVHLFHIACLTRVFLELFAHKAMVLLSSEWGRRF